MTSSSAATPPASGTPSKPAGETVTDDYASDLLRLAEQDEQMATTYDEANEVVGLRPLVRMALEDAARYRRFLANDSRRRAKTAGGHPKPDTQDPECE